MGSPSEYQRMNTIRASFSQDCGVEIPAIPFKITASVSQPINISSSAPESGVFLHHTPLAHVPHPSSRRHATSVGNRVDEARLVSPKWSESDFPPLHSPSNFTGFEQPRARSSNDAHSDGDSGSEPLASPSPSSSLSVQPATPHPLDATEAAADEGGRGDFEPSLSGQNLNILRQYESDPGQDLTVPPTPEHTLSTLTPVTPNSMQSYPLTPPSANHTADSVEVMDAFHSTPYNMTPGKANDKEDVGIMHRTDAPKHFDPFTIFVGGLDMYGTNSWDEVKLRSIFEKYGEIEDVQIVRPCEYIFAAALT